MSGTGVLREISSHAARTMAGLSLVLMTSCPLLASETGGPNQVPDRPQLATTCGVDNHAAAQLRHLPSHRSVWLIVATHDDFAKDHHDCMVGYHLETAVGDDPVQPESETYGFENSNAEWGRAISARLFGLSRDGTEVFGILRQSGKYPYAAIFFVRALRDGCARTIDLRHPFSRHGLLNGNPTIAVIGTLANGDAVISRDGDAMCRARCWRLNVATAKLTAFAGDEAIQPLYVRPS